ncbi:MAG: NAD(P)/FAD-dependent oxidoreductase [Caldilineaceae bacterium]|nr:NAD(P)/FAD-dependent oxidoreductase [Caldilineaceae bacterium]
MLPVESDVTIIGAGAAGLMAALWAGRAQPARRIIVLDGAAKVGAKILVAGGGRCNVTHDVVTVDAYAGGSRNAIKKVLQRFDVPATIACFRSLGVELKREETGKLFPTTDQARTVLDALLHGVRASGVQIYHPYRVTAIERQAKGFVVAGDWGKLHTQRLILATGGKSLPKSGSDGYGYELAKRIGHTLTPRLLPALVPLTLPKDHILCSLSGLSVDATLAVHAGNGKRIMAFTGSTLCTHFGLSGPAVLDISRYWLDTQLSDPQATLVINWLPDSDAEQLDTQLLALGKQTPINLLRRQLPERLARLLCEEAGIEPNAPGHSLTRAQRKALGRVVIEWPLPITGSRGFTYAEVTAGGVPLTEIELKTMGSRLCPGLYLCGEICDVDGRIGGYNFQWAWSSGYVAGVSV